MADRTPQPYNRREFAGALAVNAALSPFNVVILAAMLVAGLLLHKFAIVAPLAIIVYLIACARTFFDQDVANKVLERERAKHGKAVAAAPRLNPATLGPPIRDLLEQAMQREARIREAIQRAELPYTEVSEEVDGFVRLMESTAQRAQLLYEGLTDSPPKAIERRLAQLEGQTDPGKVELRDALTQQLAVQRKMQGQLQRFYDEMERLIVEMDTIRGQLVSVSASTDASNQQELAAQVRGLRDEMGAVADGMQEAYEQAPAAPAQPGASPAAPPPPPGPGAAA